VSAVAELRLALGPTAQRFGDLIANRPEARQHGVATRWREPLAIRQPLRVRQDPSEQAIDPS